MPTYISPQKFEGW